MATKSTKTKQVVKPETKEEVAIEKKVATKKEFKNDDQIPCRSVTSGELLMEGSKSGALYRWADCDYVEYVDYQDLLYATRAHSSYLFKPFFVVMDDDFISQNKELDKLYRDMYSFKDITEILDLPVNEMKGVISNLPAGVKEAVKGVASTQISNGTFDSIKKIKILDEIFGTSMLQILLDNG